jgi:hypothetical protein
MACVNKLTGHQRLYEKTRGSHAAMLLDSRVDVLAVAEDVGRHNALDKAIGKVLMKEQLKEARFGVLSSRISYELVQKAARAHLPILIALSRPTALAVQLGKTLNMTLACTSKENGLFVYCGEERLQGGVKCQTVGMTTDPNQRNEIVNPGEYRGDSFGRSTKAAAEVGLFRQSRYKSTIIEAPKNL